MIFILGQKQISKKNLVGRCVPSRTLVNATLVGGAKAGNFTDLGIVVDMDDCKERYEDPDAMVSIY